MEAAVQAEQVVLQAAQQEDALPEQAEREDALLREDRQEEQEHVLLREDRQAEREHVLQQEDQRAEQEHVLQQEDRQERIRRRTVRQGSAADLSSDRCPLDWSAVTPRITSSAQRFWLLWSACIRDTEPLRTKSDAEISLAERCLLQSIMTATSGCRSTCGNAGRKSLPAAFFNRHV